MSTRPILRALAVLTVPFVATAFSTMSWAAPKTAPQATTTNAYVALGDSYAAGVGAGSYINDGSGCSRTLKSYPGRIAAAGGYALNFQACSGATINDVTTKQLGALTTTAPSKVTVTVGGNDVGFASTMTTCLGTNTTACLNAVKAAEAKIADPSTTGIPSKLATLFGSLKGKAPNATIVATAYPQLFNGRDCSILTSFTSAEMTALNAAADKLAVATKAAADQAGIRYAEVRTPFSGHAVCASSPWIRNAQLFNQFESFHANSNGYLYGYKPVVSTALDATTTSTGTMTLTTGGKTSSDTKRGTVKTTG